MTSTPSALSRRELLSAVGLSMASAVCSSCASNPFFPTDAKPPPADELLTFDATHRSRAEVVRFAPGEEPQVTIKQHYLKLVAGRRGSDYVVGEKFTFAPRAEDGGISVSRLNEKRLAKLLRDPRIKEEFTPTLVTATGHRANQICAGQFSVDWPLLAMTPSLLDDGLIRVACSNDGGGAFLTQPFELDVERDRWYAVLLDVARSPDGAGSREHLCCLRVELSAGPAMGK